MLGAAATLAHLRDPRIDAGENRMRGMFGHHSPASLTDSALSGDPRRLARATDTLRPVTNINDPSFDESREHPGFRCLRARLSRQAGSERLGLSLWEQATRHAVMST